MTLPRTILVLCLTASAAIAAEPSTSDILKVVTRSIPSAASATPTPTTAEPGVFFAGHYSISPEVRRRAGPPMTGDHLYLLPDGSYLYTEWGCLLPETIADKGTWTFAGGRIRLATDNSVSQKPARHDRTFFPLSVEVGGMRQFFVLGFPREYNYFREKTAPPDDFMFLLCARARIAELSASDAAATKAQLMRTAWNPDFYR